MRRGSEDEKNEDGGSLLDGRMEVLEGFAGLLVSRQLQGMSLGQQVAVMTDSLGRSNEGWGLVGTVKGRTRSPRIIHIWMITKNDAGVLTKRIKN